MTFSIYIYKYTSFSVGYDLLVWSSTMYVYLKSTGETKISLLCWLKMLAVEGRMKPIAKENTLAVGIPADSHSVFWEITNGSWCWKWLGQVRHCCTKPLSIKWCYVQNKNQLTHWVFGKFNLPKSQWVSWSFWRFYFDGFIYNSSISRALEINILE